MRKADYYAAVYGIIKDNLGNTLFIKRKNTWFQDGLYGLPAGHIEWQETYFEALQREMQEEIGIEIQEKDTKLIHICHRINLWERVYFDMYFEITWYTGTARNNEPEKCEEIRFLDIYTEAKDIFQPYIYKVLEIIKTKNSPFSEYIYNL